VVVLRNVLERRGELAVLLAAGFRPRALRWLILSEHAALECLGFPIGIIAALVAVLPALLSPSAPVSYISLAVTLGLVFVSGLLWTWAAARLALRGDLLPALRNE
jgi:ABC-type antimicrobial peptide transport system permease subunit